MFYKQRMYVHMKNVKPVHPSTWKCLQHMHAHHTNIRFPEPRRKRTMCEAENMLRGLMQTCPQIRIEFLYMIEGDDNPCFWL